MDYIRDGVDSHSYLCTIVFLVRGLNTCKISFSINYDYWYMYNVQTGVGVPCTYRGGGRWGGGGGHLDWQVLRAPQYVNPVLCCTNTMQARFCSQVFVAVTVLLLYITLYVDRVVSTRSTLYRHASPNVHCTYDLTELYSTTKIGGCVSINYVKVKG